MDIKVEKKQAFRFRNPILIGVAILAFVSVVLIIKPNTSASVHAQDIWTGIVKQGDLHQQVAAFGRLKSRKPRLLTAQSNAIVDEIVLKPGAMVTPNSVIVRLSDPQIEQQVKDAQRELVQIKNQYKQLEINQQREVLSQQARLELLQAELESAELEVKALGQLIEKGIASNIDYQRRVLEQRQLTRRLDIEQKRLSQLEELHLANLAIAQSNIESEQEALTLISEVHQNLTIRAGISGVLQSLDVELGQSVNQGQRLALVGSTTDLYAQVSVPQAYMQQIALSQTVEVDTRAGLISGEVIRIDPVITNGSVQVEVKLNSQLTKNARPELNIAANIHIGTVKNALYIEKPVNAKADTNTTLFMLQQDGDTAIAKTLQYGSEAQDTIQIISGAQPNQRYILSDMSRWQEHAAISIVQ